MQTASALTGDGLEAFWQAVLDHEQALTASGEREARRREQAGAWLWRLVREGLEAAFRAHEGVQAELPELERGVESQELTAPEAARRLLETFRR